MSEILTATSTITRQGHASIGVQPSFTGASLHASLVDTSDYVQSNIGTLGDVVAIHLTNPSTSPPSNRNHFLRCAALDVGTGTRGVGFTLSLHDTYQGESAQGDFIAKIEVDNVPTVWTRYRHRLTEAEAALISDVDYSNIQIRVVMHCRGSRSGTPNQIRINRVSVEVPQVGDRSENILLSHDELKYGVPSPYDIVGVAYAG